MCQRLAVFFRSHFPFLLGAQLRHVPVFLEWAEAVYWATWNGLWAEVGIPLPVLVHESLTCNPPVLSLPPSGGQSQDTAGEPKVSRDSGTKVGRSPVPGWLCGDENPSSSQPPSPTGLELEINLTMWSHWDFWVTVFSISEFYLMTQDLMHMSEHVVIIWKSIFENVLTLFLTQDWLYSDKSPPGKVDGKKWCSTR